jgi:hypothetical protein
MKKQTKKNTQSHSAVLTKALSKYLHLDDPWVVDVALTTVVTNLIGEEPLWLLVVNPPSTGKTELVQMFKEVETCAWLAEVTENTFLSGLRGESQERGALCDRRNSLLYRWTDPNLRGDQPLVRMMLIQDFTGLITVDRKKRDAVFGQLRQIYDGRLVKSTGMGDDLLWEGYLGLFGAVTPAIDDVAELNSILGERFVLYRPLRTNVEAEAMKALGRKGNRWRDEMAVKAKQAIAQAEKGLAQVSIPSRFNKRLLALAQFTAMGRTGVQRSGYNKDITSLPAPEGPGRLIRQFQKFLLGLCAVRGRVRPTECELAVLAKVARDSIPAIRLPLIEALYLEPQSKDPLSHSTGIPQSTLFYRLEDLRVLGIAREADGMWSLTDDFQQICETGRLFPKPCTPKRKDVTGPEDQAA